MKNLFDQISSNCSRHVTQSYSTSFSMATRMLAGNIRQHIYNIYGFVRFADEIVDTFHEYPKEDLLNRFEQEMYLALEQKISLNPILNSFQYTVNTFGIELELIEAFMHSMRLDLDKHIYHTEEEYKQYIYGSADVVGLMCLKVFVQGDQEQYEALRPAAMALGSAFQKVNFLRDLKADFQQLDRSYFPQVDFNQFDEASKKRIITEIESDFAQAYTGIFQLPEGARFGVYTAYKYYLKLLRKLKNTPPLRLQSTRIRVPNYQKVSVLANSYVKYHLNLL
ncbi:MAG: phytoene/squalene synthase family protein [Flavobacteriaceae bacterium]